MNRHELIRILEMEGFSKDTYDLSGNMNPDEKYCLNQEGQSWVVYYSERGKQRNKKSFNSEGLACEYFLSLMRHDPTTKNT